MIISQIYEKYDIMPQLQAHQLRVAGVASLVCDSFTKPIDKKPVLSACLLHDMGNIIKFKLDLYPEYLEPQGLTFWENVKNEYIERYGIDEHSATYDICKELGITKKVFNLIKAVGFSKAADTFKSSDFNEKIVAYSDQRVAPFGVTSVDKRHKEGRERYIKNKNLVDKYDLAQFNQLSGFLKKVEKQIFTRCKIKPEDITEEKVKMLIEELKNFNIETK